MISFFKRIFGLKPQSQEIKVTETVDESIVKENRTEKTVSPPPSQEIPEVKEVRLFYDNEPYFTDYSYLTPAEARKEMRERKEAGEFLDFEEYGGYMNAINAEKDPDYIEKIETMTPQQVEKWFKSGIENGRWHTPDVFEAIAEKLKPYHEEFLLKEMDKVTPKRIEGWVNARKKEGYFFSDDAYDKATKIFTGAIDNRKTKKSNKE